MNPFRPGALLAALSLAAVAATAAWGSAYEQRLVTLAGCYALMALGYQLVFGLGGALSLAQGAFFGLGAYAAAILGVQLGLPLLASLPLAIAAAGFIAAAVALPVLRLEGHYFALATLGLAAVLRLTAVEAEGLTGGANGLVGLPGLGFTMPGVPSRLVLLLLVWATVLAGAAVLRRAAAGPGGPALALMSFDPLLARVSGIDPAGLRFAAFVGSAALAGAGGALYAGAEGVVSPDVLDLALMILCLAICVIGGRGTVAGALAGALVLVHLPEWLRPLGTSYRIVYGAALFACIVLLPEGLVGALEAVVPRRVVVPAAAPLPDGRGAVLSLEEVRKTFGGVRALDGASLEVRPGEVLGLIGPNGSGKTTLVNVASGVERADAGSIRLDGTAVSGRADRLARGGLARSFQGRMLPPVITALDVVAAAAGGRRGLGGLFGGPGRLRSLRAEAAGFLTEVGLGAEAAASAADRLPAGAARLVDIARALALDPRVLLLDEPAAGLDASEAEALARVIRRLAASGRAVLVIEHDMTFLMDVADRVAFMADGIVEAVGSPEEIRADPRVRAAYLGASA